GAGVCAGAGAHRAELPRSTERQAHLAGRGDEARRAHRVRLRRGLPRPGLVNQAPGDHGDVPMTETEVLIRTAEERNKYMAEANDLRYCLMGTVELLKQLRDEDQELSDGYDATVDRLLAVSERVLRGERL